MGLSYCSRSGRITLYNSEGNLLSSRRYFSRGGRNVIIRRWKILYGYSFYGCHMHICPDINHFKDDAIMKKIKLAQNNFKHKNEWDKFLW